MTSIPPISTTRVTDAMTRGRLTAQIQADQLELERLQNQLSTGYRIFLPSDDAASAQRAMTLQRTIERKEQAATNVQGSISALANTEATLADVSNAINALKSQSLAVIGSPASEEQRLGVINEIDALLDTLVQIGNTQFTGSFLLGGAEKASAPYATEGVFYEYLGDESSPQTYADIGYLFDVGTSGDSVLGGLSESVRGGVDLNPQLTTDTRLTQLNGDLGISPNGSIEIVYDPTSPSDPSATAIIDLSGAETVGDIAQLIETGAPAGSGVTVEAVGNSLRLASSSGAIAIREVGEGNTALELGIRTGETLAATVTGTDLNPTIRLNDRLDDLGGVKSAGRLALAGDNNDLVIRATANGVVFDGVEVRLEDGASSGSESASYDATANRLTVTIAGGESTATQIAAAINRDVTEFAAAVDYRDQTTAAARGTGSVAATTVASVTSGGVDGGIDLASGLRITNGTQEYVVDTSAAETVEDLLNLLNNNDYGLLATVNPGGSGIDVRSRRSGADFTIGESGGTTAADLGIRTTVTSTRLEDFNRGAGVFAPGINADDELIQNEFEITVVEDGVTNNYTIDPRGLTTVQNLFDQIATDTGGAVAGSLASTGSGLTLTVTDPDTPATAATGSFSLGGDTLTIDAAATGTSGNRNFTVEVVDNPGGSLVTTVVGDTITVDLGNTSHTTADIAASIEAQLPGFTVASDGTASISAAVGQQSAFTTGGAPASDLAVAAQGDTGLGAETLTFTADTAGAAGNAPGVTIAYSNTGAAGLETTVSPDGLSISVNLGGSDTTAGAVAASISAALPGYTVTASDGTAVLTQGDAIVNGAANALDNPIAGGRAADSITISGSYAERLGFVPAGQDSATFNSATITSSDSNPHEVDSVFTTLVRMRDALQAEDIETFGREVERLDDDLDRVTFGRAEVGVRLRNLETIEQRLADEEVQLREALSNEIDADLVEVISDFNAKQASLEASLRTSATLVSLSILDFI